MVLFILDVLSLMNYFICRLPSTRQNAVSVNTRQVMDFFTEVSTCMEPYLSTLEKE